MTDLFEKMDVDSNHLTKPHDERMRGYISSTYPGMAHWCGTGPDKKSCRECVHYEFNGYYTAGSRVSGGGLKPGRCKKFKDMMGKWGEKFPWHVSACRLFEENPIPPEKRSK